MACLEFRSGFKYPFNRPAGLLNILWVFIPIFGWFALFGYSITIVKHFIKGDFKELPKFSFADNFVLGILMFFKSVPFAIAITVVYFIVGVIPFFGILGNLFIAIFVVPILTINFFNKQTVESYFELKKVNAVFSNLGEYIIAVLKTIAIKVIFFLMIIVLIGIPAGAFAKNIFMADFYRMYVKK